MEDDKFAKDVAKNHDKADVKAALARETSDGSGFEDESELDEYEQLPDAEELAADKGLDALKPDEKEV